MHTAPGDSLKCMLLMLHFFGVGLPAFNIIKYTLHTYIEGIRRSFAIANNKWIQMLSSFHFKWKPLLSSLFQGSENVLWFFLSLLLSPFSTLFYLLIFTTFCIQYRMYMHIRKKNAESSGWINQEQPLQTEFLFRWVMTWWEQITRPTKRTE